MQEDKVKTVGGETGNALVTVLQPMDNKSLYSHIDDKSPTSTTTRKVRLPHRFLRSSRITTAITTGHSSYFPGRTCPY